jgi:hypothetical protein
MNTFANAVINQSTTTENGMLAHKSTSSACVDLFFKIGASRGKNIIPEFTSALAENEEYAIRILQWVRDVRGGAGERQIFRDALQFLEETMSFDILDKLLIKVPEIGRWDDLLVFKRYETRVKSYVLIRKAILAGNGLCAKWMPRKGQIAVELRVFMGMSPKQYRKTLVNLTKVVESQMCANDWDNINFSQVPSLASTRYKKAFNRHTTKYAEYVAALVKGDPSVKVNAGAVYPYDVIKGVYSSYSGHSYTQTEIDFIVAQWNSLENFVGDANILPMVDVSGSMTCSVGGNSNLQCLDIAVSLGLYLSEKNKGNFKDTFLTFSGAPKILYLKGNVVEKMFQMINSNWQMNTNLNAALDKILYVAKFGEVPQEEMPEMLLVLSDMQFDKSFDSGEELNETAIQMMLRKYEAAGYKMPKVIFWNLNKYDNVPVKFNESGVGLISGFSPSILKSIINNKIEEITPESIMLETIMNPRYEI